MYFFYFPFFLQYGKQVLRQQKQIGPELSTDQSFNKKSLRSAADKQKVGILLGTDVTHELIDHYD